MSENNTETPAVDLQDMIRTNPLELLRNLNKISKKSYPRTNPRTNPNNTTDAADAADAAETSAEVAKIPTRDIKQYLDRFNKKYEDTYESDLLNQGLIRSHDGKQIINHRFAFRLPETNPIADVEKYVNYMARDSPNCKLDGDDCIRNF
jgi:hypothetical protein